MIDWKVTEWKTFSLILIKVNAPFFFTCSTCHRNVNIDWNLKFVPVSYHLLLLASYQATTATFSCFSCFFFFFFIRCSQTNDRFLCCSSGVVREEFSGAAFISSGIGRNPLSAVPRGGGAPHGLPVASPSIRRGPIGGEREKKKSLPLLHTHSTSTSTSTFSGNLWPPKSTHCSGGWVPICRTAFRLPPYYSSGPKGKNLPKSPESLASALAPVKSHNLVTLQEKSFFDFAFFSRLSIVYFFFFYLPSWHLLSILVCSHLSLSLIPIF